MRKILNWKNIVAVYAACIALELIADVMFYTRYGYFPALPDFWKFALWYPVIVLTSIGVFFGTKAALNVATKRLKKKEVKPQFIVVNGEYKEP